MLIAALVVHRGLRRRRHRARQDQEGRRHRRRRRCHRRRDHRQQQALGGKGSAKRGAVVGGVVGAATGAIVGAMMDKQERELRQIEGIDVTRTDEDELKVTMRNEILFDFDSAGLRSSSRDELREMADVFNRYDDTTIVVRGPHGLDRSRVVQPAPVRAPRQRGLELPRGPRRPRLAHRRDRLRRIAARRRRTHRQRPPAQPPRRDLRQRQRVSDECGINVEMERRSATSVFLFELGGQFT